MDTLLGALFCAVMFLAQYSAVITLRQVQLDERFAKSPVRIPFFDHMGVLILPMLAMLLSFAYAAMVNPQSAGQRKIVVPGTHIEIEVPTATRNPATFLSPTLVANISAWVAAEFGLPAVDRLPRIELVSSERLARLRYGSLLKHTSNAAMDPRALNAMLRDTVAIYSDTEQTIYISNRLAGDVAVYLSVVVHELVHHAQNRAGLTFNCPQEREQLAYAAQERWLGHFGKSLAAEFELDGFSLLTKTRCHQ